MDKFEVEVEAKEHEEFRRIIPKAIAAELQDDIITKHTIGTFKINAEPRKPESGTTGTENLSAK